MNEFSKPLRIEARGDSLSAATLEFDSYDSLGPNNP